MQGGLLGRGELDPPSRPCCRAAGPILRRSEPWSNEQQRGVLSHNSTSGIESICGPAKPISPSQTGREINDVRRKTSTIPRPEETGSTTLKPRCKDDQGTVPRTMRTSETKPGGPATIGACSGPESRGPPTSSGQKASIGAGKSPAEATRSALFSSLPRPEAPTHVAAGGPAAATASMGTDPPGGRGPAAGAPPAEASHRLFMPDSGQRVTPWAPPPRMRT